MQEILKLQHGDENYPIQNLLPEFLLHVIMGNIS